MRPNASFVPDNRLPGRITGFLLPGALMLAVSCSEGSMPSEPSDTQSDVISLPSAAPFHGSSREVTIDFSSFGAGDIFESDFYRAQGIRFPPQQCGPAGCTNWSIAHVIQGDDALLAEPGFGPIKANFTKPISDLSLQVAPALQGTATYVLKAFAASGKLLAIASVTVTQDFGDPANTGFGYFTISLGNLRRPAKSFTLENVFVRSSFPLNTEIPYGVSSISYTRWGKKVHRHPK